MMNKKVISLGGSIVSAFCFALLVPTASQASLLYGTLNVSGSVNVSLGRIDFVNPFTVSSTSTGGFTALGSPVQTTGNSMNIDNPPYTVNTLVTTPNFLTFLAAPNITFTLTQILSGTQGSASCGLAPAAGQNCTPVLPQLSPFNLTNTSSGTSTASFVVLGNELDSLTMTSTPFVGIYTDQFAVPYQTLVSSVTGGATLTTSYSATFITTATPEPSTGLMFVGGAVLLGLGFASRRFSPSNK